MPNPGKSQMEQEEILATVCRIQVEFHGRFILPVIFK